MERPQRKKNRLERYDYSRAGYYFVTICAKDKAELFWNPSAGTVFGHAPTVGADMIRPPSPHLSSCGRIVERAIQNIPIHYPNVSVEKYVVMPNHVHMILAIALEDGRIISAPTKPVPIIVGQMKRYASKCAGMPLWQKSYHDHIIRNDADYRRIWDYIDTNPAGWREDRYYTESTEETP